MLFQKYKLTFTSLLSLCVILGSFSVSRVSSQSLPVLGNPHAPTYSVNEQDSSGKARREARESKSSDGESLTQLLSNNEKEKLFQRFLWEANKGKYSFPSLLKVLNHPNGWRMKVPADELVGSHSGLFEYEERGGGDIIPLGESRNSNEAKGAMMSLDSPSSISYNDIMAQKRNSNPGFICHFKLCQLGASGKRRINPPGGWNFNRDYE